MNCATLIFGGIFTSICMWSGQALASIISTFFTSHNFRSICPISVFIFPYISCLRYFGANTMWYLQFHLECAKLLMSLFIKPPVVIFVAADYSASYYTTGGFILYLQDSNSTTLSGGLFFAKATNIAKRQRKLCLFALNLMSFFVRKLI